MDIENSCKVTSIEDLKKYSAGKVVELPSFGDGEPFYARLRRPSMMALAKQGRIPNALLGEASKMFNGGPSTMSANTEDMLSNMFDICDVIVDAAMIEPTYSELKEAGIELADDQILAIFSYTQTGVEGLKQFRD